MPSRRRHSSGLSIASVLKLIPMRGNNTFWSALSFRIPVGALATEWLAVFASAQPEDGLAAGCIRWAMPYFVIHFAGFGRRCGAGFRKLKGQGHDKTFNVSSNRNFGARTGGLRRVF